MDFLGRQGTVGRLLPVDGDMNRLIEDYLRARGVRYFRGHHDEEYFYFVDFVIGASRGRLNVHLEVGGPDRDAVLISITHDRYYPAGMRADIGELAARWNMGAPPVQAVILDSCDPRLVGVLACGRHLPADGVDLAAYVDAAVASSIELFRALPEMAVLRDAG